MTRGPHVVDGKKQCSACGELKAYDAEHFIPLRRRGRVTLTAECRICRGKRSKAYYAKNSKRLIKNATERTRRRRLSPEVKKDEAERSRLRKARMLQDPAMRARHNAMGREWRMRNPDKARQFKHNSKDCKAARTMKRYAAKLCAAPKWVDNAEIRRIYEQARLLSEQTGVEHEVDHIFPLMGRDSCGLHVPWNLRIIPAEANRSKGARPPHPYEIPEVIPWANA